MTLEVNNPSNISPIQSSSNVSQTSANTSASHGSSNIPLVDIEKQKLLERLNITSDQYALILKDNPNFGTYSITKQLEVVKLFKITQSFAVTESADVEEKSDISSEFNRTEYNSMNKDAKLDKIRYEFAKNIFIYGIKNKQGETVGNLVPHSPEVWDKMTNEQRQEVVDKLLTEMKNFPGLKKLDDSIMSLSKGNLSEERQIGLIDSTMRAIQVANSKGISILEFFSLNEFEKIDATEAYLSTHKDNLSASEETYLAINGAKKNAMKEALASRGVGVSPDMSISEIAELAKYCNIDPTEEALRKLKSKKEESGLSKREEQWLQELSKFDNGNGKNIIDKYKAVNLQDLEKEFDQLNKKLDAGELLTSEEQKHYNLILKYLETDEAKYLKEEIVPNLSKPETEYEKSVAADISDYKEKINGYLNDDRLRDILTVKYLENKTANMSKEEKEKYVKTFLDFNNDRTSVAVFRHYAKEMDSLWSSKSTLSEAAINMDVANKEQARYHYETRNSAATENPYWKKCALDAANCANAVLENSEGNDSVKLLNAEYAVKLADLDYSKDEIINLFNGATDVNATIDDAKVAIEAQNKIYESENATDEVFVHATNKGKDFADAAQEAIVTGAMDRSAAATANVTDNDIISGLAKVAQSGVFKSAHRNTEKYFEGQEAINHLNNLADQIQNCDKDNQLSMHNDIMSSRYTEVQEHAAGNIGNYDPSVQNDALNTVYSTGNQSAIDAAVESVANSSSVDVVEQVSPIVIADAAIKTLESDEHAFDDLSAISTEQTIFEKIASGAKLTSQEYASLSPAEKREYFIKFFKSLSPNEKIKLIKSISSGVQKRNIYKMIARTNNDMFDRLIQDAGIAKTIYDMHISGDIDYKIESLANKKYLSNNAFAELATETENKNIDPTHLNERKTLELWKKTDDGILLG